MLYLVERFKQVIIIKSQPRDDARSNCFNSPLGRPILLSSKLTVPIKSAEKAFSSSLPHQPPSCLPSKPPPSSLFSALLSSLRPVRFSLSLSLPHLFLPPSLSFADLSCSPTFSVVLPNSASSNGLLRRQTNTIAGLTIPSLCQAGCDSSLPIYASCTSGDQTGCLTVCESGRQDALISCANCIYCESFEGKELMDGPP